MRCVAEESSLSVFFFVFVCASPAHRSAVLRSSRLRCVCLHQVRLHVKPIHGKTFSIDVGRGEACRIAQHLSSLCSSSEGST
jgi:hypothetical protein